MTNEEIIEKIRLCNKYVKQKENNVTTNHFYSIKSEWLWYFYSSKVVPVEILRVEKQENRKDKFVSLLVNNQYQVHTKVDKRWTKIVKDIKPETLVTSEDHTTPEDFNYQETVLELLFGLGDIKNYKPTNQIIRLFVLNLHCDFSIEVRTKTSSRKDELFVMSNKEKNSFLVDRQKAFNYLWPELKNKQAVSYNVFKDKMKKNKKKD